LLAIFLGLVALIFITIAVRLPWLYMLPISGAPDEGAHYWVANYLATEHSLPTLASVMANPAQNYYGSLPQFGYLPHLLIALPFANSVGPVEALIFRYGSLLSSILLALASFFIARELFSGQRLLLWAFPLLICFHPELVFVQSYINNDVFTAAVAAFVVYDSILILKYGYKWKYTLGLSFLLSILMLCKYSGYCILPAVVLIMVLSAAINKVKLDAVLKHVGVVAAIVAMCTSWWFVRNYFEFNHDLMGARTMFDVWAKAYGKPLAHLTYPFPVIIYKGWWQASFNSFFAVFGNMDICMPSHIYRGYFLFCLLSMLGWGKSFFEYFFKRNQYSQIVNFEGQLLQENKTKEALIWLFLWLLFFSNFMAMAYASATYNEGPPQGRYLFPAEIAIWAILLKGLQQWGRLAGNILISSLLAFNAYALIKSFFHLFWLYARKTGFFWGVMR
jgi:hypothetical protein